MLTNVDKYIVKFSRLVGESRSGRSHYYQIGNKVIRVSDHIGNTSNGCFHIVVLDNGYLLHHPGTGTIRICNYRQIQEFIRTFALMPVDDRVAHNLILPSPSNSSVLGVALEAFTPNQVNMIKQIVQKAKE